MIISIVQLIFQVYMLLLIIRIIGSWIPDLQQTKFMQFIGFYTDPYLNIFRRIIPPLGMLDLSPIVAFLFLGLLRYIITQILITILVCLI